MWTLRRVFCDSWLCQLQLIVELCLPELLFFFVVFLFLLFKFLVGFYVKLSCHSRRPCVALSKDFSLKEEGTPKKLVGAVLQN